MAKEYCNSLYRAVPGGPPAAPWVARICESRRSSELTPENLQTPADSFGDGGSLRTTGTPHVNERVSPQDLVGCDGDCAVSLPVQKNEPWEDHATPTHEFLGLQDDVGDPVGTWVAPAGIQVAPGPR
jgi:hypothetical protein